MQDSNRITLLGVIMVNFKTNSKPILRSQLVRKIYIYSKYSIAFPVKSFFKETKMEEKIFKYAALNLKKGDKYFLWLLQIHI